MVTDRKQAESQAWDGLVGEQSPEEFMQYSEGMTIEEAVASYVKDLPDIFPGEIEEKDLEDFDGSGYTVQELLEGYIKTAIKN